MKHIRVRGILGLGTIHDRGENRGERGFGSGRDFSPREKEKIREREGSGRGRVKRGTIRLN